VGGTGLYVRAALSDLDLGGPPPPGVRERLEAAIEERGAPALHRELAARAPRMARGIEPTDRTRVARALELLELDGAAGHVDSDRESQLWSGEMRHPTLLVGLTMRRERLYQRIDARVEAMVAAGAAAAVRQAEARGPSRTARKALGYEELLADDVDGMKRRTRRYAKRQLTWMRKMAGVEAIDATGLAPGEVAVRIAARAGWTGR
jgi:tRNA dimethylallyltransferase